MTLQTLTDALHQVLPDAELTPTRVPGLPELELWLLAPANLDRAFAAEETRRLLEHPPYWGFCWGSGLALARWVLDNPEQVRGKRVLDFGAGSGVVAPPITWTEGGEQYVSVVSGWGGAVPLWGGDMAVLTKPVAQGGSFWVFKLPRWAKD